MHYNLYQILLEMLDIFLEVTKDAETNIIADIYTNRIL
jgi:hypothetical protein